MVVRGQPGWWVVTPVPGYRPMFGEAELRDVFGPRFTRLGEPVVEYPVESPVGGGPGVPPPAGRPADCCEMSAVDEDLAAELAGVIEAVDPPPAGLGVPLVSPWRAWVARVVGTGVGRRSTP